MESTVLKLNSLFSGNIVFVGGTSFFYLGLKKKIRDIDIVIKHDDLKYLDLLEDVKYFINDSHLAIKGVHRAGAYLDGIYIDVFITEKNIKYDEIAINTEIIKIASIEDHIEHYTVLENIRKVKRFSTLKYKEILDKLFIAIANFNQ